MKQLIAAEFDGQVFSFDEQGWINATEIAGHFGKPEPAQWLRLPDTERYVEALGGHLNLGKSQIIKTKRGKNGGTWIHPKLGVLFARWCDVHFAIWCDLQIDHILRGTHPHFDWKKMRSEAASSFKVMNEALRLVREAQAKETKPYHYMNEARLVNFALTGEFVGLDREALSNDELTVLARLEVRNAVMVAQGIGYQERKKLLRLLICEEPLLYSRQTAIAA